MAHARSKQANAALKTAQLQQTENFAYEMRRLKDEEFCEMKLRQQLRENCPDLRDLRKKLNACYANKIVHEQIKEKDARRLQEQILEREQNEILAKAHVTEKEYFKQQKELELLRQEQYKRELQDQMIFQENAKRAKYEEFLKEKKLIDELVLRIQEEEAREMKQKYCAMLKTQEDIRNFMESQQTWRIKARERVEREDLAIQEFIKNKMEQTKKCAEEKEARQSARAQMCDEMAKQMYIEKVGYLFDSHASSVNEHGCRECVDRGTRWQTLPETFQQHWLIHHCSLVIVKTDFSITINVHFLRENFHHILSGFLRVIITPRTDEGLP